MPHPFAFVLTFLVLANVGVPVRVTAQAASSEAFASDQPDSDARLLPSVVSAALGPSGVEAHNGSERVRLVPHYLRMRARGRGFLAGGPSMLVVGTIVVALTLEFAPTSTHSISRGEAIGLLVGGPLVAASVPMTIVGGGLFGRANRQLGRLVPVVAWRGGECFLGVRGAL